MSIFSFDAGTSTLGWRANCAFRMRVSMSAIGSDVAIISYPRNPFDFYRLPASFRDARDLARERQLPETDAAQIELAQISAGPAATEATVAVAARQLRLALGFRLSQSLVSRDFRGSCH
jgi:hypothetical protein